MADRGDHDRLILVITMGRYTQQYDTRQDAWYFGVWVHVRKRVIVTYAEGDETRTHYATPANLTAALEDMAATYGPPPPFAIVIGHDGATTHVYDPRPTVDGLPGATEG